MAGRSWARALGAIVMLLALPVAHAQIGGPPPSKPPNTLTEQELKNLLVWDSPWEGNASNSRETISFPGATALATSSTVVNCGNELPAAGLTICTRGASTGVTVTEIGADEMASPDRGVARATIT